MVEPPPYLRIAAELQRQIESGRLRPGDRVPSTRALMREYGVAMATATKALNQLGRDGLVHTRPGVGTVVGPPPRTVRRDRPAASIALSRDEVVRVAIGIADADGIAALSMRRIATELGVSTMALYRHVGGKDALVLQMVDAVFADYPPPKPRSRGWRAVFEGVARVQWAAFRRHLWLAEAVSLSRPQFLPNLLPHTDAMLRALAPYGLDAETAMYTTIAVFGSVRGLALSLEPEARAEQDTGLTADEWAEVQGDQLTAIVTSHDLAGFRHFGVPDALDLDFDLDRLFESSLRLILDGLATRLD